MDSQIQNRPNGPTVNSQFLTSSASGVGLAALASIFRDEGLLAANITGGAPQAAAPHANDPLAVKAPHFAPRAAAQVSLVISVKEYFLKMAARFAKVYA